MRNSNSNSISTIRRKFLGTLRKLQCFFITLSFLITTGVPNSTYAESVDLSSIKKEVLQQVDFSQNLQDIINGHASKPLHLSENDKEALKLLGYSDQEINSLTLGDLGDKEEQNKLNQRVNSYANKKNSEISEGVEKDVVPGLASAVIGLAFSSLLGVVIGMKCSNQPSALVFAGTSAAWAALEMMIWKGYKINMKDIETLMNATEIPAKITKDVEEMKAIVKSVESDIRNTSADNYDTVFARNKDKLKKLKEKAQSLREYLNRAKDSQFGAIRRIQESLELAAETSEKKSKNAKIAAIGFTTAAGVATAETFKAFGDGGKCFAKTDSFNYKIINDLISIFIPTAHAAFANVADLDKIGIPLGAGLGAAYVHFEKSFANQIFNSAPSRAAIFLSMAGIAYYASVKLKKASEFLYKQAREMDVFATSVEEGLTKVNNGFDSIQDLIYEIKDGLLPAYNQLVENIKNNEKLQKVISSIKAEANNVVNSVSTSDVEELVKKELSENEGEIQATIDKGKNELGNISSSEYLSKSVSYFDYLDFLIPSATASFTGLSLKPSCFKRGRYYPVMDDDCSCKKGNRCMSSRFPSKINLKVKGDFINLVTKTGFNVSQANDFILSGNPKHGLAMYKKLSSRTSKIEKSSLALLNKKSKLINSKGILTLVKKIRNSTKEGLGEYYRSSRGRPSSLASGAIKIPIEQREKEILSPVLEKLRDDIRVAKKLGNSSLSRFNIESIPRGSNNMNEDAYNYAQETIISDPSVDIFMMIKKRYMQVHADGRL